MIQSLAINLHSTYNTHVLYHTVDKNQYYTKRVALNLYWNGITGVIYQYVCW